MESSGRIESTVKMGSRGVAEISCSLPHCNNGHLLSVKDRFIMKWTLIMESTLIMGSGRAAEVPCTFSRA